MTVKKVLLTNELMNTLIDMSKKWKDEDISWGIRVNRKKDFKDKNIFVAYDKRKIVGYLLSHVETTKKDTITIPAFSRIYYIDELYVLDEYRNKGYGKALFKKAKADAKGNDFLELTTSTKDYKKIFNFYIDELGMAFFSAMLIKKL